jgi:DNA-binding transcriptional MocR family regulator
MQKAGRERRQAVVAALEQHLAKHARFTRPEGGMSLWVRLEGQVDAQALLGRALEQGVSFLPGRYFAVHRAEPGALRLSFAGLPPAQIRAGVSILARLVHQERSRQEATPAERAAAIV